MKETPAEKLKAINDRIRSYTKKTDKLTLDGMASGVQEVYGVGIAHGQDIGYETGYTNGYIEGEEDGWSDGYGEGLDHGVVQGIEEGKKNAYDEFWDDFQQNGNRDTYIACFGTGWTAETFKPKYQIKPIRAGYMFFNNWGEKIKIPDFVEFADNLAREQGKTPETHPDMFDENGHYMLLDFSRCTNCIYLLPALQSPHFGTLDFRSAESMMSVFYSHSQDQYYGVRRIDKFISSAITAFDNSTFQNATFLTDITMSGVVAKSINFGTCPLNKASIISVVNVLSSSTTGQTVTFKKTAVNTAFGINVDDASTFTDEFKALRNSKASWTFSYA